MKVSGRDVDALEGVVVTYFLAHWLTTAQGGGQSIGVPESKSHESHAFDVDS